MHRFFLPPESFEGNLVKFPQDITHQLFHVLRLRPEAGVIVLDNRGGEFQVVLKQVSTSAASGQIVSQSPAPDESVNLALYLCLAGREKFEWMLQKCTETGAGSFTPVVSSRSLVQGRSGVEKKRARWAKIIQEAAEQSGRGKIPELFPPLTFEETCVQANRGERLALIAWEDARLAPASRTIHQVLSGGKPGIESRPICEIALVIGPEGGFSAFEIDLALNHGLIPISLGPRILRMETAAIVATALVMHEFEDRAS